MFYIFFSDCGNNNLTGSYGEFSSINYPNNYADGTFCQWNIVIPSDEPSEIILTFTDFYTEDYDNVMVSVLNLLQSLWNTRHTDIMFCQETISNFLIESSEIILTFTDFYTEDHVFEFT